MWSAFHLLNILEWNFLGLLCIDGQNVHLESRQMKRSVVFQLWPESLQYHVVTALEEAETERTEGC